MLNHEFLFSRIHYSFPDACWPWSGAVNQFGYGTVRFRRHSWLAHRVVWTLLYGDIPPGMVVCHKCDHPPCCNPAHLFIGTQQDNIADRELKGRDADRRGEKHPKAKLTESDVIQIRALKAAGVGGVEIARQFGLKLTHVSNIYRRKTWRHI